MTLDQIRVGEDAELVEIDHDLVLRTRLMEMGLTPGIRLSVMRIAPLGDPIQILGRGSRISLCKRDAAMIRCRIS